MDERTRRKRRPEESYLDVFAGFETYCHGTVVAVKRRSDHKRSTIRGNRERNVFGTEHEVKSAVLGRSVDGKPA